MYDQLGCGGQFFVSHICDDIFYSLIGLVQTISEDVIDYELYSRRRTGSKSMEVWVRHVLEHDVRCNCMSDCDRNVGLHGLRHTISDVLGCALFQEVSVKKRED